MGVRRPPQWYGLPHQCPRIQAVANGVGLGLGLVLFYWVTDLAWWRSITLRRLAYFACSCTWWYQANPVDAIVRVVGLGPCFIGTHHHHITAGYVRCQPNRVLIKTTAVPEGARANYNDSCNLITPGYILHSSFFLRPFSSFAMPPPFLPPEFHHARNTHLPAAKKSPR